jgi:hypothetical protein
MTKSSLRFTPIVLLLFVLSTCVANATPHKSKQSEFLEGAKQKRLQLENHVSILPPKKLGDKLGQAGAAAWTEVQTLLPGSGPLQAAGTLQPLLPHPDSR